MQLLSGYLPFDDPRNPNAPALSGEACHLRSLLHGLIDRNAHLLAWLCPTAAAVLCALQHPVLCALQHPMLSAFQTWHPANLSGVKLTVALSTFCCAVIWKGILTEQPSFRRSAWKEVSDEAKDFVIMLLDKVSLMPL